MMLRGRAESIWFDKAPCAGDVAMRPGRRPNSAGRRSGADRGGEGGHVTDHSEVMPKLPTLVTKLPSSAILTAALLVGALVVLLVVQLLAV
jgi:hypothetical protein